MLLNQQWVSQWFLKQKLLVKSHLVSSCSVRSHSIKSWSVNLSWYNSVLCSSGNNSQCGSTDYLAISVTININHSCVKNRMQHKEIENSDSSVNSKIINERKSELTSISNSISSFKINININIKPHQHSFHNYQN